MNSAWNKLTLSDLSPYRWRSSSYLYRLVGLVRSWRAGSLLMQWAEPLGALLVALVLALAPFVSNALIGILLVACAGFWVLLTISDGEVGGKSLTGLRFSPTFTPIHLLVLRDWSVSTVATAMSPVKAAAFTGWTKLTLYLLLFALMARVLKSPRLRSGLISVYLHASLIVSVYGLQQWFTGAPPLATWVDPESTTAKLTRAYSYLGNPNLLAGYLLPAIALSLAAMLVWQRWLPKALALTMFLVNTYCLIVTWSRGGWIGTVVMFFIFGVLLVYWWSVHLPQQWRRWAIPGVLGGSVLLLLLAVLLVEPLRDRFLSIFVGRKDSSNNFRINVWSSVVRMIRDRPILGIGPGNTAFNKIYPPYAQARFTALSAYSIPLEIAVETGIIGLSCFLWFLAVTFSSGVRQLERLRTIANPQGYWLMAAIASLGGILGHGLVDTVWYRPEVNTLWWLMVALIASFYTPKIQDSVKEQQEGVSSV